MPKGSTSTRRRSAQPTPRRSAAPRPGFRLKPDALTLMADAIGPSAYRGIKSTRPNRSILTGTNKTGGASRLLDNKQLPAAETVVLIAHRYARAAGVSFWQAAEALFDPITEPIPAELDLPAPLEAAA